MRFLQKPRLPVSVTDSLSDTRGPLLYSSLPGRRDDELPWRGAFQGFARGTERDEGGDDGEDAPRHQESPPVQLRGEVKRHHPHLEQGHQLQNSKDELLMRRVSEGW